MKRLIFLLLLLSNAFAHSNILYDINLDFSPDFKTNLVNTAESYLNTSSEEPVRFDYDWELMVVNYDINTTYSAIISPLDYSIHGFRNDKLIKIGSQEILSANDRKALAQTIFDSLPENVRSELVYGGEKKLYSGSFKYSWYRLVSGVFVANEHLEVEVDASDGEVVAWRLSLFSYSKDRINTIPSVSYQVAQRIAELKFRGVPVGFNPVLIVEKNKPVWLVKIKVLYPIYVGVDASTGEVIYSGNLRTDLPQGYDYGRDVEVVESSFVKNIYGGNK